MKSSKYIIPILLFNVLSTIGYGQIVYDFQKGIFLPGKFVENGTIIPIKTGDFAVFKIININTFRFKAEIKGQSINYVTQIPSELQLLFRQADQSTDKKNTIEGLGEAKEAVEKMKTELTDATENAIDNQDAASEADVALTKAKADLQAVSTALVAATSTLNSLTTLKGISPNKINKARKDVSELKAKQNTADSTVAVKEKEKAIADNAVGSSDVFKEAMKKLVKTCSDYVKIAQKVASIKFLRVELINLSKQDFESWDKMQERMPRVNTQEMKDNFDELSKLYAQAMALYKSAQIAAMAAGASKDELKLIVEASQQLDGGHDKITEDDYLKLIEDIMVLNEAMQTPKSFEAISPPIQMDGDYISFDVTTPPAQVNDLMPHTPSKSFRVEIPAKGGLKVDFSVGPAFSFTDGSKDNKFFLTPVVSGTANTLTKINNQNIISPGMVAMMHIYSRSGKSYAFGGMFGVGANFKSIDDVNASYYVGPSLIWGKSQKVMLSAGLSFLRVDRLKSNYTIDNTYSTSLTISDVTEKAFQGSPFLSISYNLTNRVEVR